MYWEEESVKEYIVYTEVGQHLPITCPFCSLGADTHCAVE